jgi:hypothetical protein
MPQSADEEGAARSGAGLFDLRDADFDARLVPCSLGLRALREQGEEEEETKGYEAERAPFPPRAAGAT